jgi:hypothetical protein
MELAEPAHKPLPRLRLLEQRLYETRAIFTSRLVIIATGAAGFVFFGVGIGLWIVMTNLIEVKVRYDDLCSNETECIVPITVTSRMSGDIELRYELTGFYQNHRRYVLSKSQPQLEGDYVDFEGMANCVPYRSSGTSINPDDWILPCGVFPMSVFNDTFVWLSDASLFSEFEIAFPGDRDVHQPLSTQYQTGNKWLEGNTSLFPNGQINEHFIVWMRASFLPTTQKIYAKCLDCVIEPGQYEIKIENRYPAATLGIEKYVTVTTVSTLGTKNGFLGGAYMATGLACLLLAGTFILGEFFQPRQFGEAPPRRRVRHGSNA